MVGLAVAVVGIAGFFVWRTVEEDYDHIRTMRLYLFRLDRVIVASGRRCIGVCGMTSAKIGRGVYEHTPLALMDCIIASHHFVRSGLNSRKQHSAAGNTKGGGSAYLKGLVTHQRRLRRKADDHQRFGVDSDERV